MREAMASKVLKDRWRRVEDKTLELIQLWADTFMMYEDDFKYFQLVYRQLRAEGTYIYIYIYI